MFRPNMTCFTQGFHLSAPLVFRGWDGVFADLWQVEAQKGACGHYMSPDPRLVVILSNDPQGITYRSENGKDHPVSSVAYVPAGMPLWSQITQEMQLSHLDLHFRRETLLRRLGPLAGRVNINRAIFTDTPEVLALARMIATECANGKHDDAYLDALLSAMLVALFHATEADRPTASLTPLQMRKLVAAVEDAPHLNQTNAHLAAVAGLSEGWFNTAFRKTTTTTPHKWQTSLRIARVMKAIVQNPSRPLAQIAIDNGFADQSHMSRTFKGQTGVSPAAWRREKTQLT
ncbi:MAG: hypothetical protein COB16_08575 [Rhodobacteraceae bacterium]|nr:MAG: hypothetical protein COB16_08575 [Paracoccaceae bacterium]